MVTGAKHSESQAAVAFLLRMHHPENWCNSVCLSPLHHSPHLAPAAGVGEESVYLDMEE